MSFCDVDEEVVGRTPTTTSNDDTGTDEDTNNIDKQPLVGIRFSHIIEEFIPQHGGMEAFHGLTTCQVKEQFIQPPTKSQKESYWQLLKRQGKQQHGACGDTAQAFVSHAHQYPFLDTISALQKYYLGHDKDKSSNIFCINQHRTNWSYAFLSNTFMSSI